MTILRFTPQASRRSVRVDGNSFPESRYGHLCMPEPNSGCWLWLGYLNTGDYGRVHHKPGTALAHRVIYEELIGNIPDGMQLDHLCRNRICVNPIHLEIVTSKTNTLRGLTIPARNSRKIFCVNGHPLFGLNLHVGKDGERQCRACWRDRTAAYKARKITTELAQP